MARAGNRYVGRNYARRKRRIAVLSGHHTRTYEYAYNQLGYALSTTADHVVEEGFNPHHLCGGTLGKAFQSRAVGKQRDIAARHCQALLPLRLSPSVLAFVREWDCPKCGAHNHRDLCASRNDIRYRLALEDLEHQGIEHNLAKGETTPVAGIR
jgi:hypothetical protein